MTDDQYLYEDLLRGQTWIDFGPNQFLDFKGPDSKSFLQGLITQDVYKATADRSEPTCVLDVKGGLIAYGHIHGIDQGIRLMAPGCEPSTLFKHFDKYKIMEDLNISITNPLRLFHTLHLDKDHNLEGIVKCARILRQQGYDLCLTQSEYDKRETDMKTVPSDHQVVKQLRIEAAMAHWQCDMKMGDNPLIYGLSDAISRHKGCYIGQETVAMTRDRGRPPRRFVVLSGQPTNHPDRSVLIRNEREVGAMTSLTPASPSDWLALAVIKTTHVALGEKFTDAQQNLWTITAIA